MCYDYDDYDEDNFEYDDIEFEDELDWREEEIREKLEEIERDIQIYSESIEELYIDMYKDILNKNNISFTKEEKEVEEDYNEEKLALKSVLEYLISKNNLDDEIENHKLYEEIKELEYNLNMAEFDYKNTHCY